MQARKRNVKAADGKRVARTHLEEGVYHRQRDDVAWRVLSARARHADHLAADVEHGTARVARVDRSVHLHGQLARHAAEQDAVDHAAGGAQLLAAGRKAGGDHL